MSWLDTRGREKGILNFSWASTHLNFFLNFFNFIQLWLHALYSAWIKNLPVPVVFPSYSVYDLISSRNIPVNKSPSVTNTCPFAILRALCVWLVKIMFGFECQNKYQNVSMRFLQSCIAVQNWIEVPNSIQFFCELSGQFEFSSFDKIWTWTAAQLIIELFWAEF